MEKAYPDGCPGCEVPELAAPRLVLKSAMP